ncbi:MAG: NADH-quinone oxidoreductase subunit L [Egibacteraceae bacterium]
MNLVLAVAAGSPLEQVAAAPSGSPVDFAWLLPVVPALSAALLLLAGKRLGRAASLIAIVAAGFTATMAVAIFVFLQAQPQAERTFVREVATWLDVAGFSVNWSLLVDPLSSMMLLLVTCVGLVIHIYSLGYMRGDDLYPRFFAYLNLFLAAMLLLVLGESLLVLFVGWELVGLCSYLLVGFWFSRRDYASAAKKAFVVNRIGDVGFMIAMFVTFAAFGSLSLPQVLPEAQSVLGAGSLTAAAICLLLFVGAAGKSAQIPLFVWLPDAMAGPTPVSALIHAATMVTAGVYLVARTSPLFALVPDVGMLVAGIGVLTALVAAIVACAQTDLKKILAYSTVSQLGYMFLGVGVGDYTAGVFHLLTHGFFKALLFLAAGSVMHALAEQTDIRRMGGLLRVMPFTAATSGIAVLAIAGFPFLSGFYSKEEILAAAANTGGLGTVYWAVGLVVAGLTAFYMARWFVLIFLGDARWDDGVHPHESPLSMTAPLVLLAAASVLGGLINIDPQDGFLHGWLVGSSVVAFEADAGVIPAWVLIGGAVVVSLAGILLGFLAYRRVDMATVGVGGGPRAAARRAFAVDAAYDAALARPGLALSFGLARFDSAGIDGAVNGSGRLTAGLATVGRRLQTGFVRNYALAVLAGAVLVTAILLGGAFFGGL